MVRRIFDAAAAMEGTAQKPVVVKMLMVTPTSLGIQNLSKGMSST